MDDRTTRAAQGGGTGEPGRAPPFDDALMDEALAEAYGPAVAGVETLTAAASSPSVLLSLETTSGIRARVSLREPTPHGSGPILRLPQAGAGGPPAAVGKYQLLGELARGGIGVVWKGHDSDLGRPVAVKFLLGEHRGDASLVQRFVEEAQVGGQLQHPGIVPVYDLGAADGLPFIAMKLIQGKTLAALLVERQDPGHDRLRFLRIFEQICLTMAYAHARGVIHRDLKPSNVMAGSFGEVQVMDWGFAKVLGEGGIADERRARRTWAGRDGAGEEAVETVRSIQQGFESLAGSIMGTPGYMPPEQARGAVEGMDERADVFSLGAILCEILTGRPAYSGGTQKELLQLAASCRTEAARARLESCGGDRELIELAHSCLAGDPDRRPRNAGEVAAALGAYLAVLEKRAEDARVAAAAARVKAASARKAQRLTAALSVAVIAAMAAAAGGYLWIESERAGRTAEAAHAVHRALEVAERWRGEARSSSSDDLVAWTQALASARQAGELSASPGIPVDLSEQAASLLGTIQGEEAAARERLARRAADRAMTEALERIAVPEGTLDGGERAEQNEARRKCAAYAAAFREYGLDVEQSADGPLSNRLRASAIAVTLATAIDDWALASRYVLGGGAPGWKRLLRLAGAADPDPLRQRLRAVFLQQADGRGGDASRGAALADIAREASPATLPPATLALLAKALLAAGEGTAAIDLLRAGAWLHPGEFNLHHELGLALQSMDPPEEDEAAQAYAAAVALRPANLQVRHLLGIAIGNGSQPGRAVAIFRSILETDADFAMAHHNLAVVLGKTGRAEEAMAEYRTAILLDPTLAAAHNNLGNHLREQGQPREALRCFEEALRLEPEDGGRHLNRGIALLALGRQEEAAAEYVEAIRLAPRLAIAYSNLGVLRTGVGQLDEAAQLYRKAIELEPEGAVHRFNLALLLRDQGKLSEAVAECREAVRLAPRRGDLRNELGALLRRVGDRDGAERELEEAVRLTPGEPEYGWALGEVLVEGDRGERALSVLERAQELQAEKNQTLHPVRVWLVKEARLLAGRPGDVRAILAGDQEPEDAEVALATACIAAARHLHATSARLYAMAFALEPSRGDDMASRHCLRAACEAAQAGTGRGKDAAALDDEAKSTILRQALAWLAVDLAGSRQALSQNRDAVQQSLRFLQTDASLGCVRDAGALEKLPPAEREGFQRLWRDVAALLEQASREP